MKSLERSHPTVTLLYFLAVTLPVMLCMEPLLLCISLAGALALLFSRTGGRNIRTLLYFLALLLLIALVNPLFQHDGVTVLFFLNGNPVTWEAIAFGLCAGAMTLAVLCWFLSMSQMMTTDKYLCVFGALSPKLSLMLSMALRFVPLFTKRMHAVRLAQRGLGLYRDGTLPDKLRGELRVFSVTVTWALENGIHTADSMEARGYGTGRRTAYAEYDFHAWDGALLALILLMLALTLCGLLTDAVAVTFYPALVRAERGVLAALTYAAYTLLSFLPTLLTVQEKIKWHFLQSKI
ncbi:MAG: energy-coupling factor transporter transmembrane protein EcfT [Clostridia bacterium]|nr:energy-coupling factor transporter transmembrane protein EcfT [Clostridia bacterium]